MDLGTNNLRSHEKSYSFLEHDNASNSFGELIMLQRRTLEAFATHRYLKLTRIMHAQFQQPREKSTENQARLDINF
jgi:hypothetical protein